MTNIAQVLKARRHESYSPKCLEGEFSEVRMQHLPRGMEAMLSAPAHRRGILCWRQHKARAPSHHAASSDEEALWFDRKYHPTLIAGVVSLRHLHRPLDALSLQRHLEPSGAALYLYRNLYHYLLLSYRSVKKKCMGGCGGSASATWLLLVGYVAYLSGVDTELTSEKAD